MSLIVSKGERRRPALSRLAMVASVAGALAVLAPVFAHAGTLSESVGYKYVGNTLTPVKTDWTHAFDFQGFNALAAANSITGATLTGVAFTYTNNISGSVNLVNNGSSSASGTAGITNTVFMGSSTTPLLHGNADTSYLTIDVGSDVTKSVTGTDTASMSYTTGLSAYTGAYSQTFTDKGGQSSSFTGGNVTVTPTDLGSLLVNVTYTYAAAPPKNVPEPGSLALLGTGLLGLGLVATRRKRVL